MYPSPQQDLTWSAANALCRAQNLQLASSPREGIAGDYKLDSYWQCAIQVVRSDPEFNTTDLNLWSSNCQVLNSCSQFRVIRHRPAGDTFQEGVNKMTTAGSKFALCERSEFHVFILYVFMCGIQTNVCL